VLTSNNCVQLMLLSHHCYLLLYLYDQTSNTGIDLSSLGGSGNRTCTGYISPPPPPFLTLLSICHCFHTSIYMFGNGNKYLSIMMCQCVIMLQVGGGGILTNLCI